MCACAVFFSGIAVLGNKEKRVISFRVERLLLAKRVVGGGEGRWQQSGRFVYVLFLRLFFFFSTCSLFNARSLTAGESSSYKRYGDSPLLSC